MKKSTFYFTHDYNASNDFKILRLRHQLGMEGYGIYWYIVEQLAQAGGYMPIDMIPILSMQMQVSEIKVKGVIESFELFQVVDDSFFSNRLLEHLKLREELSLKGKEGAIKRWGNSITNSPPIKDANSNPNAKERKGKEIKERKESKVFTTPTKDEVYNYMNIEKNIDWNIAEIEADKFINFYESNGWKVGKNKMKNWKAAVNNWINNLNKFATNEKNKSTGKRTWDDNTRESSTWTEGFGHINVEEFFGYTKKGNSI